MFTYLHNASLILIQMLKFETWHEIWNGIRHPFYFQKREMRDKKENKLHSESDKWRHRNTKAERQNSKSKATHIVWHGSLPRPLVCFSERLCTSSPVPSDVCTDPVCPPEDFCLNLSLWEIITHIVLKVSPLTPALWLIDCFTEPVSFTLDEQ